MLRDQGTYEAGYDHIWSIRNGIVMSTIFEAAFDKGEFVVVPIDDGGSIQRLKMHWVSTTGLDDEMDELPGRTYRSLEGKELKFKGDGRPGLRYLYWQHFESDDLWGQGGYQATFSRIEDVAK